MTTAKAFAAAKINLTLHVVGQRADGYHLLDSLVMFADVGDVIRVDAAATTSLTITGPMASQLPVNTDNLVLRAAHLLGQTGEIILEKNLPVASGMGGGSADAAATLRALSSFRKTPVPKSVAAALGADVPVCLGQVAARMTDIGTTVLPLPDLPELYAILVNPRVGVSTPEVFQHLDKKQNNPMPARIPTQISVDEFIKWLSEQRNDLQSPAIASQPVIADVLAALDDLPNVLLHRMTGSGASCFALFKSYDLAVENADALRQTHPDWWIEPARLN